jgi:hypothetical protein
MNWLREFFKSAYTRLLEEECARLRAENRALLNTLLGRVGHEPVEAGGIPPGPPVIKKSGRSWHQIQRATERQSLRKMMDRAQEARAAAEKLNGAGGESNGFD